MTTTIDSPSAALVSRIETIEYPGYTLGGRGITPVEVPKRAICLRAYFDDGEQECYVDFRPEELNDPEAFRTSVAHHLALADAHLLGSCIYDEKVEEERLAALDFDMYLEIAEPYALAIEANAASVAKKRALFADAWEIREAEMKVLYDRGELDPEDWWFDYFAEQEEMPDEDLQRLKRELKVWIQDQQMARERVEPKPPILTDNMLALFQADVATLEYRRFEARLLADFAYRPPPFEGGSRHNFIISEISRHVGLNPELSDQDIHYSVVKLVDSVRPRFGLPPDRWNRREVEIKDGEKWGRRVREQNQEKAERDLLFIQARRRLTNRLLNAETREQVAAILQGELWD